MPALAHLQPDHDETLVARLAADDLSGPEAAAAAQLVADCPACAELHADLRSIISATATLPSPRRTRDFRLTEADAARLRRTGWRRLLGRFGDTRLAFTRPLATGLVTLGIAGLVLAAGPSFLPSLGASSAATSAPALAPGAGGVELTGRTGGGSDQGAGSPIFGANSGSDSGGGVDVAASAAASLPAPAASSPAAPAAAGSASSAAPSARAGQLLTPAPAASTVDLGFGGVEVVTAPPGGPILDQNPDVGKSTDGSVVTSSGPSSLVLASLVLVGVGVALFALRWIARRTA